MAVFVSYARKDQAVVNDLVRDIERAHRDVWFDQDVTGGQAWWDTILDQIRSCELFVFALSPESLDSRACVSELRYALDLDRRVLPVMVRTVAIQLAPPEIANAHIVDYRERSADAAFALANALAYASSPPPLPEVLPEPPPVPISYMYSYRMLLEADSLTYAQQRDVFEELRTHLADEDDREVALILLAQLRRRPDITEAVGKAVDDLLAVERPARRRPAPTPKPDPPRPPRPPRDGHDEPPDPQPRWRAAAVAAAAVAVVALVGAWALVDGGEDDGDEDEADDVAVARTMDVGGDPADFEVVDDELWLALGRGAVVQLDLGTGETTEVADLAAAGGNVLLADGDDLALTLFGSGEVGYVERGSGTSERVSVAAGPPLNGVAAEDGLWFSTHTPDGGAIARFEDRREVEAHALDLRPYGLAWEDGTVFVTFHDDGSIGSVDLATGALDVEPVGGLPVDVELIDGALWVTLEDRGEVAVCDPDTLEVTARHDVGDRPWKLVAGAGSVWVTNQGQEGQPGTVSRLDPTSGARIQDDLEVGSAPDEVVVVDGRVFVANRGDGTVTELAG